LRFWKSVSVCVMVYAAMSALAEIVRMSRVS
jgi:hypothetical protein